MSARGLRSILLPGLAVIGLAVLSTSACTVCDSESDLVFSSESYGTIVGQPLQLKVVDIPDDSPMDRTDQTDQVTAWTVSPDAGAQVSGAGVFTATAPGDYTVTAEVPHRRQTPSTVVRVAAAATSIYDNHNDGAVYNGGSPASFELTEPTLIAAIENYHYGEGKGTTGGGTISLVAEGSDAQYGPWTTEARDGQGGVPNAYWTASPNIVLPAGRYTIKDSDPSTWSQNAGSGGVGMTRISGAPAE